MQITSIKITPLVAMGWRTVNQMGSDPNFSEVFSYMWRLVITYSILLAIKQFQVRRTTKNSDQGNKNIITWFTKTDS